MYKRTITEREAGQRFDKYLHKLLPEAGSGFLYKMLRKKNIVLNEKKADGSEKLVCGDTVSVYFSEETLQKFMGAGAALEAAERHFEAEAKVIYENNHILIADKPAGMLTQKAAASDFSLNDWLAAYLLNSGQINRAELMTFKPSACNRLDRNTSGIVLCSKTVTGAQMLGEALKAGACRSACNKKEKLHKFYMLYVKGHIYDEKVLKGYLVKDEKRNKVQICTEREFLNNKISADSAYVCTKCVPIRQEEDKTLLEVELITGKPHQIRAHLAGIGHPLLGDYKYGDRNWNDIYRKKFGIEHQLLHAYKVVFEEMGEPFGDLSGREFVSPLPEIFEILGKEFI